MRLLLILSLLFLYSCAYTVDRSSSLNGDNLEMLIDEIEISIANHSYSIRAVGEQESKKSCKTIKDGYTPQILACSIIDSLGPVNSGSNNLNLEAKLRVTYGLGEDESLRGVWRWLNILSLTIIPYWEDHKYKFEFVSDDGRILKNHDYTIRMYRFLLILPFSIFVDDFAEKEQEIFSSAVEGKFKKSLNEE